jgi:hypothetical protein
MYVPPRHRVYLLLTIQPGTLDIVYRAMTSDMPRGSHGRTRTIEEDIRNRRQVRDMIETVDLTVRCPDLTRGLADDLAYASAQARQATSRAGFGLQYVSYFFHR